MLSLHVDTPQSSLNRPRLFKIDQIATKDCSKLGAVALEAPRKHFKECPMMSPEPGPNRLNMKFSESGRKVVIHLVRGLPPKISRDQKTITITFPDRFPVRNKPSKP